jgi:hypothetical protein
MEQAGVFVVPHSGDRCRCGHCGFVGFCYGGYTPTGVSAPWCRRCQRNDLLEVVGEDVVEEPIVVPPHAVEDPDKPCRCVMTREGSLVVVAGPRDKHTDAACQRALDTVPPSSLRDLEIELDEARFLAAHAVEQEGRCAGLVFRFREALYTRLGGRLRWQGPAPEDLADDGVTLKRPVPEWRWPFGSRPYHQDNCGLRSRGLFCDCAASDAEDKDWGKRP